MRFVVVAALGLIAVGVVRTAVAEPRHGPPLAQTANWAGYVVRSRTLLTETSARFAVPRLDCKATPDAGAATWVGIGGAGRRAGPLIQTGVQTVCVHGAQTVNAGWWERYPPYGQVFFHTMTVAPGDRIAASVRRSRDGRAWVTRVDDLSTDVSGLMRTGDGWGTASDASPGTWLARAGRAPGLTYGGGYTAEWIEEAYGDALSSRLAPLAAFGTVRFTRLTTSLPSWSLAHATRYGIVENGTVLAAPSAPAASGRAFRVLYRPGG